MVGLTHDELDAAGRYWMETEVSLCTEGEACALVTLHCQFDAVEHFVPTSTKPRYELYMGDIHQLRADGLWYLADWLPRAIVVDLHAQVTRRFDEMSKPDYT